MAKIALNPTVFARQLNSVILFSEEMNAGQWSKWFQRGVSNPQETFKFMWENAPFLEARFNKGFSEAMSEAIAGAEQVNKNWNEWTKFLTLGS